MPKTVARPAGFLGGDKGACLRFAPRTFQQRHVLAQARVRHMRDKIGDCHLGQAPETYVFGLTYADKRAVDPSLGIRRDSAPPRRRRNALSNAP